MPEENTTQPAAPSRSAMALSRVRNVGLSVRPYPSTPGLGPSTGSRWYGAANTGPGASGCPGTAAGRPACTALVPSPVTGSLRLCLAAHQRGDRHPGVDALVADPLHLLGDRDLHAARAGQVADGQAT